MISRDISERLVVVAAVLEGHLGCVVAITVDSVNSRMYSASINNTIIQWDLTTTPPTQLSVLTGFNAGHVAADGAGLLKAAGTSCNRNANFLSNFSIENAERMENCP